MTTQENGKYREKNPAGIDNGNFKLNCTDLAKKNLKEYGAMSGTPTEMSALSDGIEKGATTKAYNTTATKEIGKNSGNNGSREEQ